MPREYLRENESVLFNDDMFLTAPVEPGTVLLENLFGTGSDLITTSRVDRTNS